MVEAGRWSAKSLSKDPSHPIQGNVCGTIWPTCSLHSAERWFDELYFWTEGFEASTSQRARIQSFALKHAFDTLASNESEQIAVTLSFGTVERWLEHFASALEKHPLHSQRVVVMLRGSFQRLRSRYRLRAFVEYLRILKIPVGYRMNTSRISMELDALAFVRPDFAKVLAPRSTRIEPWHDLVLEARVADLSTERLIVAGLETQAQLDLARQAGIPFGQGSAIMAARAPRGHTPEEAALATAGVSQRQGADRPPAAQAVPSLSANHCPSWNDLARMWDVSERHVASESSRKEG